MLKRIPQGVLNEFYPRTAALLNTAAMVKPE
jgi:hypothetical protein